jgi:hypothetical protein
VGNLSLSFQIGQKVVMPTNLTIQVPLLTSYVPVQGEPDFACFI